MSVYMDLGEREVCCKQMQNILPGICIVHCIECFAADRADDLIAMGTNWNPPPTSNGSSNGGASLRNGRPSHPAAVSSASNLLMPVGGGGRNKNINSRGALVPAARQLKQGGYALTYGGPLTISLIIIPLKIT